MIPEIIIPDAIIKGIITLLKIKFPANTTRYEITASKITIIF